MPKDYGVTMAREDTKAFKITKKSSAMYSSVDWSGLTPQSG